MDHEDALNTKILVVAESIDIDDSSGSKANVALILNLKKIGYDIRVYHYTRTEIDLPDIPTTAIKEKKYTLFYFLSRLQRKIQHGLNINLAKHLEPFFGFSFTLFNDQNSLKTGLLKIQGFEPDLILTLSKGGSFRPHHALLKIPQWHSKWIAYMHDPYPMSQFPLPYKWNEPGYRKKENFVAEISEKAAVSAFPSLLLKHWMGQFHPRFLKTGVIIPHQIMELYSVSSNFPKFFNPQFFNLLHAGNLLGARNPKGLILGYQRFLKENPEAKSLSRLIFIGGNNSWIKELGDNENVLIGEEYINFNEVLKMQQLTAVNIILEAKSNVSPFLPGKFPHCVSADKPILLLSPGKSETKRLLGEGYEFWSTIDDVERIKKLLITLFYEWKKDPAEFHLNRPDLISYLSTPYLKSTVGSILKRTE